MLASVPLLHQADSHMWLLLPGLLLPSLELSLLLLLLPVLHCCYFLQVKPPCSHQVIFCSPGALLLEPDTVCVHRARRGCNHACCIHCIGCARHVNCEEQQRQRQYCTSQHKPAQVTASSTGIDSVVATSREPAHVSKHVAGMQACRRKRHTLSQPLAGFRD